MPRGTDRGRETIRLLDGEFRRDPIRESIERHAHRGDKIRRGRAREPVQSHFIVDE